jgi:hypothetical protein
MIWVADGSGCVEVVVGEGKLSAPQVLLQLQLQCQHTRSRLLQWANDGLRGIYVEALAIDPLTPSTIYAGAENGVLKSMDGGGTWNEANIGLPGTGRCLP